MESKPKWKGTDKPGGSEFYAPASHKHEKDCPACRYGTIRNKLGAWLCIDCGAKFSREALEKIEKAKK
jgi:ribosomal protein L37AE/L43A